MGFAALTTGIGLEVIPRFLPCRRDDLAARPRSRDNSPALPRQDAGDRVRRAHPVLLLELPRIAALSQCEPPVSATRFQKLEPGKPRTHQSLRIRRGDSTLPVSPGPATPRLTDDFSHLAPVPGCPASILQRARHLRIGGHYDAFARAFFPHTNPSGVSIRKSKLSASNALATPGTWVHLSDICIMLRQRPVGSDRSKWIALGGRIYACQDRPFGVVCA